MPLTHRHPGLSITELAVDPAHVGRTTYPVRLRLSRRLAPHETEALEALLSDATVEQQSILLDETCLEDVAREIETWNRAVERAERIAEERSGADVRHVTEASDQVLKEHRGRGTTPESYMH
ncbi:hypothetical protein [Nocardioides taihuensis]|uniref:Uncharacterized protein n=1 Tax=Nocardioides taihuensis TaxID=1835606 RepID=A0ABW0BRH7_9ACTN